MQEAKKEEVLEEVLEDLEKESQADQTEDSVKEAETTEDTASETEEKDTGETAEETEGSSKEDSDDNKKGFFKKKKDKKDEQIEDLTDRLRRQMAEFENFRKRTEKEKSQMFDMGAKTIVEKVLPVIDNFERGLAAVPEDKKEDAFVVGMDKIYKQFLTTLEEAGRISACRRICLLFHPAEKQHPSLSGTRRTHHRRLSGKGRRIRLGGT